MIQSILTLFNTCSLFGGVRQKIVDIIYHILDEMPSVHFLSLPLLSAGDYIIICVLYYFLWITSSLKHQMCVIYINIVHTCM